jgi:predicted GTPase
VSWFVELLQQRIGMGSFPLSSAPSRQKNMSSLPVVAIIGRPNVGKSTIVNRLAQVQDAIVFDQPGITRDRTYKRAFWQDREFTVVDTGGLVFDDDTEFLPMIREQAMAALSEASVIWKLPGGCASSRCR